MYQNGIARANHYKKMLYPIKVVPHNETSNRQFQKGIKACRYVNAIPI